MVKRIHSKYGYETPEATKMFAHLEKWLSSDKERELLEQVKSKEVKHETND